MNIHGRKGRHRVPTEITSLSSQTNYITFLTAINIKFDSMFLF